MPFWWPSLIQADVVRDNFNYNNNDKEEVVDLVYRSPEERREAGLQHELVEGVSVSTFLELEKETSEIHLVQEQSTISESAHPVQVLQLGVIGSWGDSFETEWILEVERDEKTRGLIDEATLSWEFEDLGISLGRFNLLFGEYYSYFVTGPMLEFGETRGNNFTLDYAFDDRLEALLYVFESTVDRSDKNNKLDWGAGIEFKTHQEHFQLGVGFISDLAESEEGFLEDESNRFEHQVGAWSMYSMFAFSDFELSVELIKAADAFRELDEGENQPFATSTELTYFFNDQLFVSGRIETSEEYADAPETQAGIALSWTPINKVSVSVEYLRGEFKSGFAETDDELEIDRRDLFAVRLLLAI